MTFQNIINACQRRSCVNMTIINDEILEDNETFEVTLEPNPDLDSRILLAPITAEINIIDDDCKLYTMLYIQSVRCDSCYLNHCIHTYRCSGGI